jgi:hypothetical protein
MRQKQAFLIIVLFLVNSLTFSAKAQKLPIELNKNTNDAAPNLIVITTDGLRWQEVFNGMDFALANNKKFNHGDSAYIFKKYGSSLINDAAVVMERRSKLLPFITKTMGTKGL